VNQFILLQRESLQDKPMSRMLCSIGLKGFLLVSCLFAIVRGVGVAHLHESISTTVTVSTENCHWLASAGYRWRPLAGRACRCVGYRPPPSGSPGRRRPRQTGSRQEVSSSGRRPAHLLAVVWRGVWEDRERRGVRLIRSTRLQCCWKCSGNTHFWSMLT